jgi:glutaredoxin-like protein
MPLLKDEDKNYLKNEFATKLTNPVKVVNFTQELECQFCRETHQVLTEVAELSDKIKLEVYNFAIDKEKAARYKIDKIPATVIEGSKDYGIRLYGMPSGYEFSSLIEGIMDVSTGASGLLPETKAKIATITKPVHIQVFVTVTCPYCPQVVRIAQKLAMENDNISADMIESVEFPHLAQRYNVYGVPKTVINDRIMFEGALPEPEFVEQVMKAVE